MREVHYIRPLCGQEGGGDPGIFRYVEEQILKRAPETEALIAARGLDAFLFSLRIVEISLLKESLDRWLSQMQDFLCPILGDVMESPVLDRCSVPHAFELLAILRALSTPRVNYKGASATLLPPSCPITRQPMDLDIEELRTDTEITLKILSADRAFHPAYQLQKEILDWLRNLDRINSLSSSNEKRDFSDLLLALQLKLPNELVCALLRHPESVKVLGSYAPQDPPFIESNFNGHVVRVEAGVNLKKTRVQEVLFYKALLLGCSKEVLEVLYPPGFVFHPYGILQGVSLQGIEFLMEKGTRFGRFELSFAILRGDCCKEIQPRLRKAGCTVNLQWVLFDHLTVLSNGKWVVPKQELIEQFLVQLIEADGEQEPNDRRLNEITRQPHKGAVEKLIELGAVPSSTTLEKIMQSNFTDRSLDVVEFLLQRGVVLTEECLVLRFKGRVSLINLSLIEMLQRFLLEQAPAMQPLLEQKGLNALRFFLNANHIRGLANLIISYRQEPELGVPKEFICPISGDLMTAPVIDLYDEEVTREKIFSQKALPEEDGVRFDLELQQRILDWLKGLQKGFEERGKRIEELRRRLPLDLGIPEEFRDGVGQVKAYPLRQHALPHQLFDREALDELDWQLPTGKYVNRVDLYLEISLQERILTWLEEVLPA